MGKKKRELHHKTNEDYHMNEKDVKNQLIKRLQIISNDHEFLLSVIHAAWHTDDRKKVIAFIDEGSNVTYENIILLALTLYEKREEKPAE